MPDNGWTKYEYHVLQELERLSNTVERLEKKLDEMSRCIAALNVKSGVWGAIAGLIPASLLLIWLWIKGKFSG